MTPHLILVEIESRFGEWIEQAGSESNRLTIQLLCEMVQKERDEIQYLKKRLETICATSNN